MDAVTRLPEQGVVRMGAFRQKWPLTGFMQGTTRFGSDDAINMQTMSLLEATYRVLSIVTKVAVKP